MREAIDCPSPFDIEPTCFTFDPSRVLAHARMILESTDLPQKDLRIAVGLVIPSKNNPHEILYGLRDPSYHSEYRDTWGLPSMGISEDEFANAGLQGGRLDHVPQRMSEKKLGNTHLEFDHVVGWTGRLRLSRIDPQFTSDYYLLLVDIQTKPLDPTSVPEQTEAYRQLRWLTPDEHTALIRATPLRACGACSELASLAARLGKL